MIAEFSVQLEKDAIQLENNIAGFTFQIKMELVTALRLMCAKCGLRGHR